MQTLFKSISKNKNYQTHASLSGTLHKKGGKVSHFENKGVEFSEFLCFVKMASPDKIVHPQFPFVKLAAAVDPAGIRDIQDSIIPAGYGK